MTPVWKHSPPHVLAYTEPHNSGRIAVVSVPAMMVSMMVSMVVEGIWSEISLLVCVPTVLGFWAASSIRAIDCVGMVCRVCAG